MQGGMKGEVRIGREESEGEVRAGEVRERARQATAH
jgi:hypothetical protein